MNVITERYSLYEGDCISTMRGFPDNEFSTVITDPPYGLGKQPDMMEVLRHWMNGDDYQATGGGFMSKSWDSFVPGPATWKEVYRVLKPGGLCLVFAGTRTFDLMTLALRLAGFEIRDCCMWLHGQGMPKGANISKHIDAHLGAERDVIGQHIQSKSRPQAHPGGVLNEDTGGLINSWDITAPATDAAKLWAGWHTGLSPAWEPIIVAMKPLEKTFAHNALQHGVAGLNIDGTRISTDEDRSRPPRTPNGIYGNGHGTNLTPTDNHAAGRWPANLILSQSAASLLDEMSGETKSTGGNGSGFSRATFQHSGKAIVKDGPDGLGYGDQGGISRYFTVLPDSEPRFCYTPKSSTSERSQGTEDLITWESVDLNPEMEALHRLLRDTSDDTTRQLNEHAWNTGSYGNGSMEKFPTGIKSIIKTASKLIIDLKTSNLLTPQHTRDCTLAAIRQMMADGLNLVENAESINQWIQIITSGLVVSVPGVVPAVLKMLLQISAKGRLGNGHSTVKPLSLMRWLVRLTKTPTGGSVLDPFGGSGTTVIACLLEGRHCTYIDKEREYFEITRHRSEHWQDEASIEPRKLRGKDNDLSGMPLFAEIQGG